MTKPPCTEPGKTASYQISSNRYIPISKFYKALGADSPLIEAASSLSHSNSAIIAAFCLQAVACTLTPWPSISNCRTAAAQQLSDDLGKIQLLRKVVYKRQIHIFIIN
jgi:hypothetical protein